MVAQEALHTLQNRKGLNGGFILKVDLEKAYDRIDWSFLRKVLDYTGFNAGLKELIMECISTTRLQVWWNDQVTEPFMPTRGLRQRDPLSPYLFVLCMEVLGQSITKAVEDKRRKPINVAGNTTHLSHIFFADDLLLFGHASFFQARVMEFILAHFCGFSRQRVNRGKSRTWFSPNTPLYLKNSICSEFKIPATSNLGRYLGSPLFHE